jgi:hypothetical protein
VLVSADRVDVMSVSLHAIMESGSTFGEVRARGSGRDDGSAWRDSVCAVFRAAKAPERRRTVAKGLQLPLFHRLNATAQGCRRKSFERKDTSAASAPVLL